VKGPPIESHKSSRNQVMRNHVTSTIVPTAAPFMTNQSMFTQNAQAIKGNISLRSVCGKKIRGTQFGINTSVDAIGQN
jgi:hypothetical protein